MGDRYTLSLDCAYCGAENEEVWYAPTCGSYDFVCGNCKKTNYISSDHKSKKLEEVTLDDIKVGFLSCTSASWSDDEIDEMCKEELKELEKLKSKQ